MPHLDVTAGGRRGRSTPLNQVRSTFSTPKAEVPRGDRHPCAGFLSGGSFPFDRIDKMLGEIIRNEIESRIAKRECCSRPASHVCHGERQSFQSTQSTATTGRIHLNQSYHFLKRGPAPSASRSYRSTAFSNSSRLKEQHWFFSAA